MNEAQIVKALKDSGILPYPQQLYGDKSNIHAIALELFSGSGDIARIIQKNNNNLPVINGDREHLKKALGQSYVALVGLAIALGYTVKEIQQSGVNHLE